MMTRRLSPVLAFAASLAVLLAGCGQNPLAPTLETGTDDLSASDGETSTFYFNTSQGSFGSFSLFVLFSGSTVSKYISAVGVCEGSGNVAPTDPAAYEDEVSLSFGSYFLMTDGVPHYAKITVRVIEEDFQEQTVTITFDWVLQTEAGNPNLS